MAKKPTAKKTAKKPEAVSKEAAESMEKAKRWATRGDAKAAADEFRRFPRSDDDFNALRALHPDIQVLVWGWA
jgi:hypothetical protein